MLVEVCCVYMQVVPSFEKSSRLLTAGYSGILPSSNILSFYFIASATDLLYFPLAVEYLFYKMFFHLVFLQNLSSIKYFHKTIFLRVSYNHWRSHVEARGVN